MSTSLRGGLAAALAAIAGAAQGHHDWSEYDRSKPLTVAGLISQSDYRYPHSHIQLQTPDKAWLVVLAPPSRMKTRGLPAGALKPGTAAEVVGYAHRRKGEEMRADRITIDGRTIRLH